MKAIKYMAVAGMMALTASCSDFLEEYSQSSYYAESWEDLDELLVGSGYLQPQGCQVMGYSTNFGSFIHYLADELDENNIASSGGVLSNSKPYTFGYYTWQQRAGQNQEYTDYYDDSEEWTQCYYGINVMNNILVALESVPCATEEEIRGCGKVRGEAYFLRALYYFWLVNMYGQPYNAATAATDLGVPLKTSENVEDRKFDRNSVKEVYDQIVSDLEAAREGFRAYDAEKSSIYRADSTAVNLLLSRVYLYMGRWQDCVDAAGRVLDGHGTLMDLNGSGTGSFAVADNVENIFSMGGSDLPLQMGYMYQGCRVNSELYNSYSDNDLRRTQWYWRNGIFVGCVKNEKGSDQIPLEDPTYYNENYVGSSLLGTGWEAKTIPVSSVFIFRTAEAYLNMAEAEAYLGHEKEARGWVNQLRNYRFQDGAADVDITSSGEALVKDIRAERRRELAFEGHRWFDLRRYRVCPVFPERISLTHYYTFYKDALEAEMTGRRCYVLTEDDPSWTLPIPYEVLEFNTGMQGNGNPFRMGENVALPLN